MYIKKMNLYLILINYIVTYSDKTIFSLIAKYEIIILSERLRIKI